MSINPTIIIPGIGQSKIDIVNANGQKIKSAWPLDIDTNAILGELKGSLTKMMIFRKDAGFSDKVEKLFREMAAPVSVGRNGRPAGNVRPVSYPGSVAECSPEDKQFIYRMIPMQELGEEIGEDKLFFFAFNPFGNLFDTADALDAFIANVKEKTGSGKVNLIAVSLGGVVLRAYLMKYAGKADVEKVVSVVAALDGTDVVADVLEKKLYLDDPVALLRNMGGRLAKVASMAQMVPQDVMKKTIDKVFAAACDSVIYNCTMIWGLIPNARFDAIAASLLSGRSPEVQNEIKAFHDYTADFAGKAKALAENGMSFYQICGYDRELIPVVYSKNESSDSMINLSSASFGAPRAKAGSGEVDPSGCVFPERTWFFRDQWHDGIAYNDVALTIVKNIITEKLDTVNDDPGFPQINGVRDTHRLRVALIPRAKRALETAEPGVKEALQAAIEEYEKLRQNTVIGPGDNAAELTRRLEELLSNEK